MSRLKPEHGNLNPFTGVTYSCLGMFDLALKYQAALPVTLDAWSGRAGRQAGRADSIVRRLFIFQATFVAPLVQLVQAVLQQFDSLQ